MDEEDINQCASQNRMRRTVQGKVRTPLAFVQYLAQNLHTAVYIQALSHYLFRPELTENSVFVPEQSTIYRPFFQEISTRCTLAMNAGGTFERFKIFPDVKGLRGSDWSIINYD